MARVYVSVGSNIDRERYIRAGLAALRERYGPLQCSRIYESKAVGFDGDDFYNLVVGFDTEQPVRDVAAALREIEQQNARDRRAPRSCATPSYWGRWPRSRANGVIRRTAGVSPNYGQTWPTRPRSRCGPSRSMWLDAMRPARAGIPRTT